MPPINVNRRWVIPAIFICAMMAVPVAVRWLRFGVHIPGFQSSDQQPYGKSSGAELRKSWQEEQRRRSAQLSDADLQRMVERLFVQDDPRRENFDGLLFADTRPLPFLLKALNDPRTSTAVFAGNDKYGLGNSPFERICNLLWAIRPPDAVAPLARYLDNPNPKFRAKAAWVLASIGTRECLEPVKKALDDTGEGVREMTLIGLTSKTKGKPRDVQFLSGAFTAIVPLLNDGKYGPETPASAMMAIDPARAVPVLELPQYFSDRNPQFAEVLDALDSKGVKVPRKILLPLLAKLKPPVTNKSSGQGIYAEVLTLYANNPDVQTEGKLHALINSPSTAVSSAASQGLETLAGMDVRAVVMGLYNSRGFDAMTRPQQFCFAVELYRDEVDNGGHEQYFYNDDSDLFETAEEGLRAMGANAQAAILTGASHVFGPGKPPPTEGARRQQMESFGESERLILNTADNRFYQLEDEPGKRLDTLMTLYALQHRSDFAVSLLVENRKTAHASSVESP